MRRTSEYAKFPGHCFVTRSSDTSHGVLDLDHYVDGEGAVMLSGKVVEEAAGLWGYLSPEKALDLEERILDLKAENNALRAKIARGDDLAEAAQAVIDHLKSADSPLRDAIA